MTDAILNVIRMSSRGEAIMVVLRPYLDVNIDDNIRTLDSIHGSVDKKHIFITDF